MYLNITKTALDKQIPAAQKLAAKELSSEPNVKDLLLWLDEGEQDVEFDADQGTLTVSEETELGYLSLTVQLDLDLEIKILEHVAKAVNRMKAALESVK